MLSVDGGFVFVPIISVMIFQVSLAFELAFFKIQSEKYKLRDKRTNLVNLLRFILYVSKLL